MESSILGMSPPGRLAPPLVDHPLAPPRGRAPVLAAGEDELAFHAPRVLPRTGGVAAGEPAVRKRPHAPPLPAVGALGHGVAAVGVDDRGLDGIVRLAATEGMLGRHLDVPAPLARLVDLAGLATGLPALVA